MASTGLGCRDYGKILMFPCLKIDGSTYIQYLLKIYVKEYLGMFFRHKIISIK